MINTDELVPLMIFQWIKGDKEGSEEIIKDVEVMGEFVWVNFQGGGRINGHVINEMMNLIGVAQPEDVEKHLIKQEEIAFEPSLASVPTPKNIPAAPSVPTPKQDFGFEILDKANRDSKMKLNLLIDFDFISKDKIKMLLELYGDDLFESLKSYVRQQLTEDVIESCIEHYLVQEYRAREVILEEVNNLEQENDKDE